MSGGLLTLLFALLAVAVSMAVLIYSARMRARFSQAEPVRMSPHATTGECSDEVSDTDEPGCPESRLGEEVARDLRMSSDGAGGSAAAAEAYPDPVGGPTSTEPVARPRNTTNQSDLTVASEEAHAEHLINTGAQPEIADELNASPDEEEPKQERPVRCVSQQNNEANDDHSLDSATPDVTSVADLTDRLIEEHTAADAAPPGEPLSGVEAVSASLTESTSDDGQVRGPAVQDEGDRPKDEPTTRDQLSPRKQVRKKPPKYTGITRKAPQMNDAAQPSPNPAEREQAVQGEKSLPIQIRLRFDRDGFCDVSFIARRSASLPDDLTVVASEGKVHLRAMQDEWYQDVVPDDFSSVLRNGAVWMQQGTNGQCKWSLSGRELYVLASRPDISGYVSQSCLDLGRDHVVLCTEPLRSRVEEALLAAEAQPTTVLDQTFGTPPGWLVFRNVIPNAPVPPSNDADIFNALRPLPGIQISLERGIRIGHANWLEGHPPLIRVYGDPEHASDVRIDGRVAERLENGAYRTSAWDAVGSHSVWCAGRSKSYRIVPFEASWKLWDAYAFSFAPGSAQKLAICGPITRAASTEPWGSESFSVPETNPILLGSEPGQIVMAIRASRLHGAPLIASPGFRPIWALPRDPLHCDKKITHVLCVAGSDPPETIKHLGSASSSSNDAAVVRWCRMILDAGRKGLTMDPDSESVRALWLSHKHLARNIWRSRR